MGTPGKTSIEFLSELAWAGAGVVIAQFGQTESLDGANVRSARECSRRTQRQEVGYYAAAASTTCASSASRFDCER